MAHCLGTKARQNCPLSSLVRQSHWLDSADGQSYWLGFLLRCPWRCSYRVGHLASQVLSLRFLIRQDWGLYSTVGGGSSLLPCPGGAAEQAGRPALLVVLGANQAELCIKYSGHMGSPAWLWRWAEPLAGISSSTVRRNLLCPDLSAGYRKPCPPLMWSPVSSPAASLWSPWDETQMGLTGGDPQCWEGGCPPWALCVPLEKP